MNITRELLKIAKLLLSKTAESEAEKFLMSLIPKTRFRSRVFTVGGYVRDEYLGEEAKDLDIVVEQKDGAKKLTKWLYKEFPNEIHRPLQMGAHYPIWQITFTDDIVYKGEKYLTKGAVIEFADSMGESFPDSNSRQRQVEPGVSIDKDIERRDFTVNMLLKDLSTGEIKDLTGTSKNDIEKGILRGHPKVSLDKIFSDDPLRMLRLIRFQAKYGWDIPLSVLKTVKRNARRIKIVSAERIIEELKKVMKLGKLSKALRLMKMTGLLKYVMPEVDALKGVLQDERHHQEGDVWKHTLMVLDKAKPTIEGQLAALLHDIGKPAVRKEMDYQGKRIVRFLGHEKEGSEIAESILRRLKLDRNTINRVRRIVENHMRPHMLSEKPSKKAIRKFVREVGSDLVDDVLDMAEADELGKLPPSKAVPELRKKIQEVLNEPEATRTKPVLDGREIMDILDIKAGPLVGSVSKFLMELQDENPNITKNEAKEAILEEYGDK